MRMLTVGAVLAIAGAAVAQTETIVLDIENFGDPAEVVFDGTFDLPAIDSIDMVSIDLAHSWGSDIELILTSPGGDIFTITDDLGRIAEVLDVEHYRLGLGHGGPGDGQNGPNSQHAHVCLLSPKGTASKSRLCGIYEQ
ncbi:MAG: hypothetical protein AAFV77_08215 [Planctomycetota bacterium]